MDEGSRVGPETSSSVQNANPEKQPFKRPRLSTSFYDLTGKACLGSGTPKAKFPIYHVKNNT